MQGFLIGSIVSQPLSVQRRLHISPTSPSCDILKAFKAALSLVMLPLLPISDFPLAHAKREVGGFRSGDYN